MLLLFGRVYFCVGGGEWRRDATGEEGPEEAGLRRSFSDDMASDCVLCFRVFPANILYIWYICLMFPVNRCKNPGENWGGERIFWLLRGGVAW